MNRRSGLSCNKFVALEVDAEAFRIKRIDEGRAGEIAGKGAVTRRNFACIFRPDDTARALHVCNNDIRLSINVTPDMLCKQTAFDVGWSACGKVDQQGKPLAAVERLATLRRRGGKHKRTGKQRASSGSAAQASSLLFSVVPNLQSLT
jgi:hypothetical protein